jgi:hypothetical protein
LKSDVLEARVRERPASIIYYWAFLESSGIVVCQGVVM